MNQKFYEERKNENNATLLCQIAWNFKEIMQMSLKFNK